MTSDWKEERRDKEANEDQTITREVADVQPTRKDAYLGSWRGVRMTQHNSIAEVHSATEARYAVTELDALDGSYRKRPCQVSGQGPRGHIYQRLPCL